MTLLFFAISTFFLGLIAIASGGTTALAYLLSGGLPDGSTLTSALTQPPRVVDSSTASAILAGLTIASPLVFLGTAIVGAIGGRNEQRDTGDFPHQPGSNR